MATSRVSYHVGMSLGVMTNMRKPNLLMKWPVWASRGTWWRRMDGRRVLEERTAVALRLPSPTPSLASDYSPRGNNPPPQTSLYKPPLWDSDSTGPFCRKRHPQREFFHCSTWMCTALNENWCPHRSADWRLTACLCKSLNESFSSSYYVCIRIFPLLFHSASKQLMDRVAAWLKHARYTQFCMWVSPQDWSILCLSVSDSLLPTPMGFFPPIRANGRPTPPVRITSLAPQNTVAPKALNKVVLLVLFALKELISCQLMSLHVFV